MKTKSRQALSLALSLFIITGSFIFAPPAAADNDNWKEIYQAKIEEICKVDEFENGFYPVFRLVDIDSDCVPELFVYYEWDELLLREIYTLYDNRLIKLTVPRNSYWPTISWDDFPVYRDKVTGQPKIVSSTSEIVYSGGEENEYFVTDIIKNGQAIQIINRFRIREEFDSADQHFTFNQPQNKWVLVAKAAYETERNKYYTTLERIPAANGKYSLFYIPQSAPEYAYRVARANEVTLDQISTFLDGFSLPPTSPFDTASSWAIDGITSALDKGFVPADSQNNYKYVITRAEFCRMAVKWMEYATEKSIDSVLSEGGIIRDANAFTDTKDPDILAAFALGITNGTGNKKFSPDSQFTREQAATMIMNTCKVIGADISNSSASGFADLNTASNWAVSGINFVYANGIMSGMGNNTFSPKSLYTREQSIITFDNIDLDALLVP